MYITECKVGLRLSISCWLGVGRGRKGGIGGNGKCLCSGYMSYLQMHHGPGISLTKSLSLGKVHSRFKARKKGGKEMKERGERKMSKRKKERIKNKKGKKKNRKSKTKRKEEKEKVEGWKEEASEREGERNLQFCRW